MNHMSLGEMFIPLEDGFHRALCSCGWGAGDKVGAEAMVGLYPSIEDAVDAFAGHVYEAGFNAGAEEFRSKISDEISAIRKELL